MTQTRNITVKMTPRALRILRLIAAATNERQYAVLTRLLTAEAKRLGIQAPPEAAKQGSASRNSSGETED